MQSPPPTGGSQRAKGGSLNGLNGLDRPPQLSDMSTVPNPNPFIPQSNTFAVTKIMPGEAIVPAQDAFEPGSTWHSTSLLVCCRFGGDSPKRKRAMAGALTNSPFTATAPLPEPAGNTTIPKCCATVKPLEVAVTVMLHTPSAGLDQSVVAPPGAENAESGQSEVLP